MKIIDGIIYINYSNVLYQSNIKEFNIDNNYEILNKTSDIKRHKLRKSYNTAWYAYNKGIGETLHNGKTCKFSLFYRYFML